MNDFCSVELDEGHALAEFDCGVPSLNDWLSRLASSASKAGTARTWVWTDFDSDRVLAYFAIAPHQVSREEVPSGMSGGASRILGYILARLALDRSLHGQGLGAELLHDALGRIVEAADIAGGRLIVVDAIDDSAAALYAKYGFKSVKENPRRLFIKIATVRTVLMPTED